MRTSVVVIGAGQAGLAMSHQLTATSIDHVVLERHEVAHSWRSERWDSLRLLTPNWMTRLPGCRYRGDDPDGFMSSADVVKYLDDYRRSFSAPIHNHTSVEHVRPRATGVDVQTDQGTWHARAVVVATGSCSEPLVPAMAASLPPRIRQITSLAYRRPDQLGDGQVLVVGASASGAQIADELQRSGRQVTLAVGEHVRLPRTYRGRDIHWWMDAIGQLDERYDEVDDIDRARRLASLQLVGSPERRTLDLNALIAAGVDVVGRLARIVGRTAQFSGGLANLVANADLKQRRLLDRIDEFVTENERADELDEPTRPEATRLGTVPTELSLPPFETVVWATGYRPTYPWLDAAAFDRRHRVVHDGGVGAIPGMYFLGIPFMRRRKSSFIDGVGPDASELVDHVIGHLGRRGS
ncbi:NAD(P)/FAD-dependent oxidoreductase [soil metagenome]